jgi:hypothetical protein
MRRTSRSHVMYIKQLLIAQRNLLAWSRYVA